MVARLRDGGRVDDGQEHAEPARSWPGGVDEASGQDGRRALDTARGSSGGCPVAHVPPCTTEACTPSGYRRWPTGRRVADRCTVPNRPEHRLHPLPERLRRCSWRTRVDLRPPAAGAWCRGSSVTGRAAGRSCSVDFSRTTSSGTGTGAPAKATTRAWLHTASPSNDPR